jgi:enoyl-CoA hydratase/carnithine racemase
MQSTDVLIYEVRDRKAYITMNRPQRMNAQSPTCQQGYRLDQQISGAEH